MCTGTRIREVVNSLGSVIADNEQPIIVQCKALLALRHLNRGILDCTVAEHWDSLIAKLHQKTVMDGASNCYLEDVLIVSFCFNIIVSHRNTSATLTINRCTRQPLSRSCGTRFLLSISCLHHLGDRVNRYGKQDLNSIAWLGISSVLQWFVSATSLIVYADSCRKIEQKRKDGLTTNFTGRLEVSRNRYPNSGGNCADSSKATI